jgi:cyclic pyranopterin phosphate synthase
MDEFSHVDDEDRVQMVDVGDKDAVDRRAVATGRIALQPETAATIDAGEVAKGNVLATARIAAIQAVKRTWDDIPLCHQIPVDGVTVEFEVGEAAIESTVEVSSTGQTGVEMEALNGVTRALLTVFDMVKAAEKDDDGEYPEARIEDVRVVEKHKEAPS